MKIFRFLMLVFTSLFAFFLFLPVKAAPLKESNFAKAVYVPDEVIVKFKEDTKPFRVIKIPEGKVGEKIKEYLERKDVEYAEPNYLAYTQLVPNDPYYIYQWHLDNPVFGGIEMEQAWEIASGSGVTVAVVDTGIRKGTDLVNTCFVAGWDYVNNDNDPVDDNGHGTHVAGTIGQGTDNSLGVAGVAFGSCLMPVKVLDAKGVGTYANIALGIRYAADNGAKVINLSLGGSSSDNTLREALKYAYEKGVTIVAACGNENKSNCLYPAAYDEYVIAVGATQYDETKAPYSNYGPSLDLVAPGGNTKLDQNKDGYGDGVLQQTFTSSGERITWGYYFFQGTSMATPHVSGTAALLVAKGEVTTPDQIRTVLQTTAEDKGATGRDDVYGWGLVNAAAALGATPTPTGTPTPTPTPTSPPTVVCWKGSYQYLYRNDSQARKFCKCAQGSYGYKSYVSRILRATVYQYVDTGNNENWSVTSRSSNLPVYQVTCSDNLPYLTNKDYSWPK